MYSEAALALKQMRRLGVAKLRVGQPWWGFWRPCLSNGLVARRIPCRVSRPATKVMTYTVSTNGRNFMFCEDVGYTDRRKDSMELYRSLILLSAIHVQDR